MNIKNSGRYCVPTDEDFEPDSNNEVLKNYLSIKSNDQIAVLEEQELKRTELELVKIFDASHGFTAEDICNIHELWLGDVYPSAGKYRTVAMSKDGFPFAAPTRIETAMLTFEKNYLTKYTPCHYDDSPQLAYALGIVHVELIVIHPFREGNGRTARLLADLMTMQANKPPLNFASIDQTKNEKGFRQYILAIHAGLSGNYEPITEIFKVLLKQSIP
jgi:cell filamentation protein